MKSEHTAYKSFEKNEPELEEMLTDLQYQVTGR